MIRAVNLTKSYRRHKHVVPVLQGIDLELQPGEFLSIVGASGSGKSTLLHVLGTLDKADSGMIFFGDERIDQLSSKERDRYRNEKFGFIFQFYHLLPELSAIENVMMPGLIGSSLFSWWQKRKQIKKRATELLERVGLGHRLHHKPREMSGGEMQRTAIARALIASPKVLFADEPTGNLDAEAADEIIRLLREINREERVTILMVTHNLELARLSDRVVKMSSGKFSPLSVNAPALGYQPLNEVPHLCLPAPQV